MSVYLSRLEARRHDHENPDFRLALTLLRDVLEGNWPWGDRHEHEIRQRRSPKADVAQYFYPRWTKIVNLVEEALQSAAADPRKLHELARDQVSPDVAERTQRAVLLAILWAVHNRLEHVRRAGLISQDALKLTERIEKLMATCMHAEQRGSSGSADLATV